MFDQDQVSEEIALRYWGKEKEKSYCDIVGRVVNHLFDDERSRNRMFGLLNNKWFLPNSPVFMNSGTELNSLAACFVLPLEDNIQSIFGLANDMAIVMKEGGGVGVSLSRLRPEGAQVKKTRGVSSGPISFLGVYDKVVETVKQGGTR